MGENIMNSETQGVQRNMFLRIILAVVWFMIILLVGNMVAGGIAGGMAGNQVQTAGLDMAGAFEAGQQAGAQAAQELMANHGGKIFLAEVIIWLVLLVLGLLPGTTKYKKKKPIVAT
jgi:hypothetical protein